MNDWFMIEVSILHIVDVYNKSMGDVDLFDIFRSLYQGDCKSTK